MKIKRLKKLKVNSFTFDITWNPKHNGASFNYGERKIVLGTKGQRDRELLQLICHELMELAAVEMHVRFPRPDCEGDYLFVYDHRQHETMTNMFAGLLSQFITQ